jgi:hypothetical protein
MAMNFTPESKTTLTLTIETAGLTQLIINKNENSVKGHQIISIFKTNSYDY